jgi:hypothetical protein
LKSVDLPTFVRPKMTTTGIFFVILGIYFSIYEKVAISKGDEVKSFKVKSYKVVER